MSITTDIQRLDPGPLVTLYKIDFTMLGGTILYFHGHNDGPIVFQGITYQPYPLEARGFARTSDQQPSPTLAVANLNGNISALCLTYEDLVGAMLTRKRTFARYLDGAPEANPLEEYQPEIWFIERKSMEAREAVEFELSSALDFQGQELPGRLVLANQCPFRYRGDGCEYTGPPVATITDEPTSDPLLDRCGHRLQSCKLRLWPDGVLNFGGFPAAGLVRT